MSASSASSMLSSLRALRAFGLLALLVWPALAAPPAAARIVPDSTRPVPGVTIDDHGVRIGVTTSNDTIEVYRHGLHHKRIVHVNGGTVVVDADGDGIVRVFADADVPVGEHVDGDVVAVFGSVDVGGSVSGDVVAVFGSVHLAPGAAVDGDVVAIGGVLDHADGATIGGQSVSLGFLPVIAGMPALPVLLLTILIGWALTLFAGWLLTLIFPDRLERIAVTATRQTAGSFFLGVVSVPLLVVTLALLFITVIGIPLAFLLPLVYIMIVWSGQIAASYVLGCKLTRRRIGQGGAMFPILSATAFVALFFVIGAALSGPPGLSRSLALFSSLFGVLLVAGLSTIGTGAFLLSRAGSRPGDVRPDSAPSPSPSAGGSIMPDPGSHATAAPGVMSS
jgi:hypothetical protein